MVKSDMKEISPENNGSMDKNKDKNANDMLDYLCWRVENLTKNADCYTFGEDLTISFEDCSGVDFLDLLRSVEDYGIDLENIQIHTDGDGWIAVDVIIG
ncbi:MAG: hypothetical protein R6U44_11725 [Archaeoglobaceae archaeon]